MSTNETGRDWLTEAEAGAYLGQIPQATLRQWRWLQQGPPYTKAGRRVLYSRRGLD